MTAELNTDEVALLDRVVLHRLSECYPATDWFTAVRDLKEAGRLGLVLDDPWVHVSLDRHVLVSVDRERLTLALYADDPLGEVLAGQT